jgi:hypothetical protein
VSTDLRARTLLDGAAKRQREIRVGQGRAGRKPGPRPSSTRFVALICAPQAYSFLRERCPSRAPGETLAGIISSSLRLLLHGGRIDAATTVLCAWLDRETTDIRHPASATATATASHRIGETPPFHATHRRWRPSIAHVRARRIFEDASKVLKPPWNDGSRRSTNRAPRPSEAGVGDLVSGTPLFRHHTQFRAAGQ